MKKKIRRRVGDVVQISLPDGRYAYGRLYRDASVGIYRTITDEPQNPPIGSRDFRFHVGLYEDLVTSGKFPVVGRDPFENPESEWPPPYYMKDKISGEYSLYHKGEIREASESECKGLEAAAVWDLQHIVDRIMQNSDQS